MNVLMSGWVGWVGGWVGGRRPTYHHHSIVLFLFLLYFGWLGDFFQSLHEAGFRHVLAVYRWRKVGGWVGGWVGEVI